MTLHAGGELTVECAQVGPLMTNCYVLAAGGTCWIVDVGMPPVEPLLAAVGRAGLTPERILITHAHGDHIGGLDEVRSALPGAAVTAPGDEVHMFADAQANLSAPFGFDVICPPPDQTLRPGDVLEMGALAVRVLDVSGHSPGGVAYYFPAAGVVLTGDSLFADGVGRCDIPGADGRRLISNIRENLLTLPDETLVLPGHGPTTTIARERRGNPFLT